MNAPVDAPALGAAPLAEQITAACDRIAPTWPLDRFIAVNPYWGWREQRWTDAAAALEVLAGTRLTMPRAWFREQWAASRFDDRDLQAAIDAVSSPLTPESLIAAMGRESTATARLPLVTDLRDAGRVPRPGTSWTELVAHQTSQHCAAHFDRFQARWQPDPSQQLFGSWRESLAVDRGIAWHRGRKWLRARLDSMPTEPRAAIGVALEALGMPEAGRTAYLTAVLMALSGWAAWCAYERWQARLAGGEDDHIEHLLAARLVWELLLRDDAPEPLPHDWARRWKAADDAIARAAAERQIDTLLQRALEFGYQRSLVTGLTRAPVTDAQPAPSAQAVFCIDVRSEVFRRALESVAPEVHTRGFAGFFGLPIAYRPLGSAQTRPQLPGLLSAAQCATDAVLDASGLDELEQDPSTDPRMAQAAPGQQRTRSLGEALSARRRDALSWRQRWSEFRSAPASAFSFVESMGWLSGAGLLRASFPGAAAAPPIEHEGLPAAAAATMRPRLPLADTDPQAAAAMAHGILTAMGLVRDFAPLVLLVGHGSTSANNPHAAGLDCGACGGQTGEVNARALADLLNHSAVRAALAARGLTIPPQTRFVPALHNTTTDEVTLFDTGDLPAPARCALEALRTRLAEAGERARAERAPGLGLARLADQPALLARAVRARANDWAQVRPEWGLADNAAFVVAPRARTRGLDLGGRVFLHDYDWRRDADLAVLTLIMTAPMVVTNWINLQYHASAVDNRRYGSGNKLLHNVVGGCIGVFEGNGGDLRIGLPLQSLHDGQALRHTPLRLSVFVEAPRDAIDTVIAEQVIVRQLVENGWLHLLRIEPGGAFVEQRLSGRWRRMV